MRAWLLLIVVAACSKSSSEPAPAPTPAAAPAPDRDELVSSLAVDSITYAEKLPGLLLAFDGDCAAHANRLLMLEPLVSSIRKRSMDLTADEVRDIQDVIVGTGALAELESVIDRLTNEAIDAITVADVAPKARDELVSLARYVAWRDK